MASPQAREKIVRVSIHSPSVIFETWVSVLDVCIGQLVTALEWPLYICVGWLKCPTSDVYRLWSSGSRRGSVGSVGDQDRDVDWKCMTTRCSALDVRISQSECAVRATWCDNGSAGLNLRAVMVSTEVWKVRLEIDDVLQWKEQCHPKLIWNIGR